MGPVRSAEEFAADEDHVGAVTGNDGFGLMGVGDAADGSGRDICAVFDGFGEVDLVAGADGDIGVCGGAAAADIDEIEAEGHEGLGEFDAVFNCPTAFDPIGAGDAHHEGFFGGESSTAGGDDFAVEASSIFE